MSVNEPSSPSTYTSRVICTVRSISMRGTTRSASAQALISSTIEPGSVRPPAALRTVRSPAPTLALTHNSMA